MLRKGDDLGKERYKILELLGQGGMGKVWKASDKKINPASLVAIKEFEPHPDYKLNEEQKKNLRDSFVKEAELLAGLDHEAFPKVRDYIVYDDETPCIIMDFVSGKDFAQLLTERTNKSFEASHLFDWLDQLLDALRYLHAYAIVHKDIKPENLKLTQNNRIKMLDFGIAKGAVGEMTIPQRSIPLGSLQYAPLEQALKACPAELRTNLAKLNKTNVKEFIDKKTCHQTDIFALCATMYRLFAGTLPENFSAISRASFVWNNEPDPLPLLHEINRDIPQKISELIRQGMNLEIEDRIESASAMRKALKQIKESEQQKKNKRDHQILENKLRKEFEKNFTELNEEFKRQFRESKQHTEELTLVKTQLSERIIQLNEDLRKAKDEVQIKKSEFEDKYSNFPMLKEQIIKDTIDAFGSALIGEVNKKTVVVSPKFVNLSFFREEEKYFLDRLEAEFSEKIGKEKIQLEKRNVELENELNNLKEKSNLNDRNSTKKLNFPLTIISILLFSILLWQGWTYYAKPSAESVFKSGVSKAGTRDYKGAISDFEEAIKLNPEYAHAYLEKGYSSFYIGNYYEAIVDITKAIELEPKNSNAYNIRGFVFEQIKEYEKAIADYEEAIKSNPTNSLPYNNKGRVYIIQRKFDEAIEWLIKATELNPQYIGAYNHLVDIYTKKKQYDKAIDYCKKSISINPNNEESLLQCGYLYESKQDYQEARNYFTNAIQINPNNANSYFHRAWVSNDLKDYSQAINDYGKVIELQPNNSSAYNNRGLAYFNLGKYEDAINDYNKAIEIEPKITNSYRNRGVVYSKLGEKGKADADFEKQKEIDREIEATKKTN